MKIVKSNVKDEDKSLALDILNKLRCGVRVFGSPAAGLKKTLKTYDLPETDSYDDISFKLNDYEREEQIAKIKKGIKGEETLAEYFEKIIRLDRELSDLIVFASLGEEREDKDYIPDTDFLCVYGDSYLAVDAKCINTRADVPIYVKDNAIYSAASKDPILEVNPSTNVWRSKLGFDKDISGCVCIINKSGALVFKNDEWYVSDVKPIHVSELVEFLHDWVKDKDTVTDLECLTSIAKEQIKTSEKSIDLSYAKKIFGV